MHHKERSILWIIRCVTALLLMRRHLEKMGYFIRRVSPTNYFISKVNPKTAELMKIKVSELHSKLDNYCIK
jgi:hypothetical protein